MGKGYSVYVSFFDLIAPVDDEKLTAAWEFVELCTARKKARSTSFSGLEGCYVIELGPFDTEDKALIVTKQITGQHAYKPFDSSDIHAQIESLDEEIELTDELLEELIKRQDAEDMKKEEERENMTVE